jgi:hypothetical protein
MIFINRPSGNLNFFCNYLKWNNINQFIKIANLRNYLHGTSLIKSDLGLCQFDHMCQLYEWSHEAAFT